MIENLAEIAYCIFNLLKRVWTQGCSEVCILCVRRSITL